MVPLGKWDPKVHADNQVPEVKRDLPGLRDHEVNQEHKVYKEDKVREDFQVKQDLRDHRG